ncbi:geranylgeranyl pyrophosphate synthase [Crossiella equi]|uniref:Geranylgeranyl pyrophosphate synthase n=1 Tax=Crossiella equi TaxID=130796 RepID=A0ABS5AQZ7_9PSEU|nr:polyprenyl synthetase family protein [Crossiella equi]MBP2478667.1 geranylgeranyl pyrophosphate synthase [Crossiella equi]
MRLEEFPARLTKAVEREYRELLAPFGLDRHAPALAAGRLLRSRLAATAAGEPSQALLRRCTALELLHTSTLVHDDIVDRGELRRGVPTLWRAVGTDRAILIGSVLATRALSLAHAEGPELAGRFLATSQRVNLAQLHEVDQRGRLKERGAHEDIAVGKSGAMIELALFLGAASGTPWPVDLTHLRAAVRELGTGLQYADDVEDVRAWLDRSADRSKGGGHDLDLGNFTLPVTLLARRTGLGPPEVLRAGRADWDAALTAALVVAEEHLQHAVDHLGRAADTALTRRVTDWVRQVVGAWREKGLDRMVAGQDPAHQERTGSRG